MANKFHGVIKSGKTDVTLPLLIMSLEGARLTGLLAADITANYYRQGAAAPVAFAVSNRASLNAAHVDGAILEVDDTLFPGVYLLDLPDAFAAAGADFAALSLSGDGFLFQEIYALESHGAAEVFEGLADAGGGATSSEILTALKADDQWEMMYALATGNRTIVYPSAFPGAGTITLHTTAGNVIYDVVWNVDKRPLTMVKRA